MRASADTFIVELPLVTGDEERRILSKAFSFARMLYNATLSQALGRLQRMREDARWREAREMHKGSERNQIFRKLHQEYDLTENGLRTMANRHRVASGRNCLGAHEAQNIGKTVYRALERYLFKKGGKPRFKSYHRGLHSISGTDNRELMWKADKRIFVWRKHVYQVKIPSTPYYEEALNHRVKYCTLVHRTIKSQVRWYLQLAMEGLPPVRHVYAPKCEVIGIDPGPSKIAYFSEREVGFLEVAMGVKNYDQVIQVLLRKMDRSKRVTNPQNFNDDGTCKKGTKHWKFSNNYLKLKSELQEIYRCMAQTRKRDHGTLANYLLQLGGTIKIEKNSYRSFQRNFGKSTQRHGMGEFVSTIKRKAASADLVVEELNAYELKMSQYDPMTDTYTKKPLKQRWHRVGETNTIVQRDVFSAFLACHVTDKGHDREQLLTKWRAAELLLRDAGLCLTYQPRNDQDWAQALSRLTREPKPTVWIQTDKRCISNTVYAERRLAANPTGSNRKCSAQVAVNPSN